MKDGQRRKHNERKLEKRKIIDMNIKITYFGLVVIMSNQVRKKEQILDIPGELITFFASRRIHNNL